MRGYGYSRNYLADTQMRIIIIWENRRGRASGKSMVKRPRCAKKCDQLWAVWSSLL